MVAKWLKQKERQTDRHIMRISVGVKEKSRGRLVFGHTEMSRTSAAGHDSGPLSSVMVSVSCSTWEKDGDSSCHPHMLMGSQ